MARGERTCPDCGSIACPQSEKIKGRRVYGCSNAYCGHVFYRYKGEIVTVKYEPWEQDLFKNYDPPVPVIAVRDIVELDGRAQGVHKNTPGYMVRKWFSGMIDVQFTGEHRTWTVTPDAVKEVQAVRKGE
jgi:hypothetical protein